MFHSPGLVSAKGNGIEVNFDHFYPYSSYLSMYNIFIIASRIVQKVCDFFHFNGDGV